MKEFLEFLIFSEILNFAQISHMSAASTRNRSLRHILNEEDAKMLQRYGIVKVSDIVDRKSFHLMEIIDVSQERAKNITLTVLRSVSARPVTALELLRKSKTSIRNIETGFEEIDHVLCGGLPSGSISEIVGMSGIGKSQFCFTTCSIVLSDNRTRESGVVYIDTEMKFSPARVQEIVRHRSDGNNIREMMSRLHVFRPKHSEELVSVLRSLESYIIEHNIGLLVLDSMAFHVLKEFNSSQIVRRQALLGSIASILKWIAEAFRIPVLVTNHAIVGSADSLKAALGTAWSHCVNTRFVMREHDNQRLLCIEKSPIAPPLSVPYTIGPMGLVPLEKNVSME